MASFGFLGSKRLPPINTGSDAGAVVAGAVVAGAVVADVGALASGDLSHSCARPVIYVVMPGVFSSSLCFVSHALVGSVSLSTSRPCL